MSRFWTNRAVLSGLYYGALFKAFLRFRDPRRRKADGHRVAFYTKAWREAAESLGGTWRPLDDKIGQIELGGSVTRVTDNTCEIDGPVTIALLIDKTLVHRVLQDEGLRVPKHLCFDYKDLGRAAAFLLQANGGRCVVKPSNGTGGGRGVTTGIRTPSQLAKAAAAAAVYTDDLLIEQQIEGDNYRLLYLDGELIDSISRRSPSVIADGKSSVSQLIRQMNGERLAAEAGLSQVLLTIDADVHRTLEKQNLTLRSVPPGGTTVVLKTVVNENGGLDNTTATPLLCESVIEDGRRAVSALCVRLAGVDVITSDPGVPLAESGGVILEVNAPPNLYYHYHKSDGCTPVAIPILRRLLLDRADHEGASFSTMTEAAVGTEH